MTRWHVRAAVVLAIGSGMPVAARWWETPRPIATTAPTSAIDSPAEPPPEPLVATPAERPTLVATETPTPLSAATATTTPAEEPSPTSTSSETPTATPVFRCDPPVLDHQPSEPFDLLAIIEVESRRPGSIGSNPLATAKLQACALGGDALVMLYRNERLPGSSGIITAPGTLPNPEIRAAVIRYRRQ